MQSVALGAVFLGCLVACGTTTAAEEADSKPLLDEPPRPLVFCETATSSGTRALFAIQADRRLATSQRRWSIRWWTVGGQGGGVEMDLEDIRIEASGRHLAFTAAAEGHLVKVDVPEEEASVATVDIQIPEYVAVVGSPAPYECRWDAAALPPSMPPSQP